MIKAIYYTALIKIQIPICFSKDQAEFVTAVGWICIIDNPDNLSSCTPQVGFEACQHFRQMAACSDDAVVTGCIIKIVNKVTILRKNYIWDFKIIFSGS